MTEFGVALGLHAQDDMGAKGVSQIKVNVIGPGRVGKTLISLLSAIPECSVQDVLCARGQSARNITQAAGTGRAVEQYAELRSADLWMLTVPDTQISVVASRLTETFSGRESSRQAPIAVHCSGFFPAEQMAPLLELDWRLASLHPVLSFADPVSAQKQFKGALCGLEGDQDAVEFVRPLIEKMGAKCFPIKSDKKSLYHAAAVISNNFTVVLQALAREAWAASGVPDEIAQQLNANLLRGTCENVSAHGPRDALTGPASRGDEFVVTTQGEDVTEWHPAAGSLYKDLSELARNLKRTGTTLNGRKENGGLGRGLDQ